MVWEGGDECAEWGITKEEEVIAALFCYAYLPWYLGIHRSVALVAVKEVKMLEVRWGNGYTT